MVTYEGWVKFSNLQSEKSVRLNNKISFPLTSASDTAKLQLRHIRKSSKQKFNFSAAFTNK